MTGLWKRQVRSLDGSVYVTDTDVGRVSRRHVGHSNKKLHFGHTDHGLTGLSWVNPIIGNWREHSQVHTIVKGMMALCWTD